MPLLKRTPLYSTHLASHAKLVDFGGWEMPLHYGSQINEHHAVRNDAGMFDVSHMRAVDVTGADARAFLRLLLANNIDKLTQPGKALYSTMLNPQGGVIDDLIAYFFTETNFRLVVNASTAEKDFAWMQQVRVDHSFAVELKLRDDLAMIAVQGPNAREKCWQALLTQMPQLRAATQNLGLFFAASIQQKEEWLFARTGYTGEDGFEIALPAEQAATLWQQLQAAGVQPCGLGARDTLRLEAGMNLYGQDMNDQTSPLDAGLAWTVDLKSERYFIGKTALLEQGQHQQFLGLKLLDKGVMRSHQTVHTAHGVGEITSGTFSPSLNVSLAFAHLPLAMQPGDTVEVDIRGRLVAAQTVSLPFYRRKK